MKLNVIITKVWIAVVDAPNMHVYVYVYVYVSVVCVTAPNLFITSWFIHIFVNSIKSSKVE